MARKRNTRRRRRGSLAWLYKTLCLALILGAIAVALSLFFKVEEISVSGAERYSQQEIIAASGLRSGDNLFLMNKYGVAQSISQALPYVETVSINRRLPAGVEIRVKECNCNVSIQQEGTVWHLCASRRIVNTGLAEGTVQITGVTLEAPAVGGRAVAAEGSEQRLETMQAILEALRDRDMLGRTQSIRLEDEEKIVLRYDNRFNVELPWGADYAYKVDFLAAVVAKLESYESGTLKMMADGEARLIAG